MYNLNSCRFGLAAAASATALAAASPALAEEQPDRDYAPSDIIVSAKWAGYAADDGSTSTKTPTPLIDTPQAVSVLTRDQLDDQNVRQLRLVSTIRAPIVGIEAYGLTVVDTLPIPPRTPEGDEASS